MYAFTAPLLIVAFVDRLWLAILIDIISVQSYWTLNEVARDLEDPFVYPPNDLALCHIQVSLLCLPASPFGGSAGVAKATQRCMSTAC